MSLIEELNGRLQQYEAQVAQLRSQLVALEQLIGAIRLLLAEVRREQGKQIPLVAPSPNGKAKAVSVPALIEEILAGGQKIRFSYARDMVRQRLYPHKDPIEVGKLVGAALKRAVEKGKAERLSRGLYRAKNGVAPSQS